MTFEEKTQWAYGFATLVTTVAYFCWLGGQLADEPAAAIGYRSALLWALGASILINAVGAGIARASVPEGADRADVRDREVNRRGDALSFYIFSVLAAVPLVLGLFEAHAFWIVNSLFAAFALTAVAGVVIRAVLYRRGV